MREEQAEFIKCIDITYSYNLAKKCESIKTHPILGYRTAGSQAEKQMGELLFQEMKQIGLTCVTKDEVVVDEWEFSKANMHWKSEDGTIHTVSLTSGQIDFVTEGFQEYSLVYAGSGDLEDYQYIDVEGRLVLVELNSRQLRQIQYYAYQAYKKSAIALIVVPDDTVSIDEGALLATDCLGNPEAAVFMMAKADGRLLKTALDIKEESQEKKITVQFDAVSKIKKNGNTFNIVGCLEGEDDKLKHDSILLLTAHYDSYFQGFQKNNAAVSMLLGIAKSMIESGYKPQGTIVFCAMAACEWGKTESKYASSTGAYKEIMDIHPEWRGKVRANINLELAAHANGKKHVIRSVYEYVEFLKEFIKTVPQDLLAYPHGIGIVAPVHSWTDDFVMATSGIPSMMNDFTGGSNIEALNHSKFDERNFYQENVYRYHHVLYGLLTIALDRKPVVPLSFELLFTAMEECLNERLCKSADIGLSALFTALTRAKTVARQLYVACGTMEVNEAVEKELLQLFQYEQNKLVKLNWQDEVMFPHTYVQNNLFYIKMAIKSLEKGDYNAASTNLSNIANNGQAFSFEREVYDYFTEYVTENLDEKLLWGKDKIMYHIHLYDLIDSLKRKNRTIGSSFVEELEALFKLQRQEEKRLREIIYNELLIVREMKQRMNKILHLIKS